MVYYITIHKNQYNYLYHLLFCRGQPAETVKSSTTASSLPTKQERKENEQESGNVPPIVSKGLGPHLSNGSSKPQRQPLHHAQPTSTTTSSASLTNGSSLNADASHRNHPHMFTAPPSDLRLRQPSSTLHSVNSSSGKDSPSTRQNAPSHPAYSSNSSTKNAVAALSSREKTTGSSAAKNTQSTPPTVLTEMDKSTGTVTVISPKQATEAPPPSFTSDRKPDKPDKITLKKVDSPQSVHPRDVSHPVSIDSSGIPPHTRKMKSARRSGSKLQRSPQPPEPKSTTPYPAVPTVAPSVSETQSRSKPEGFARKESESSIKSTDSESTSSSDKLDEREDSEAVVSQEVVAETSAAKTAHPLAKEPNTGQTLPLTPVSDAPDIKSIALEIQKKDKEETTSSVSGGGGGRGKGKKRSSRQQLKREEKPKRKEREKERERERERERRERSVREHAKPERVNSEELGKRREVSGDSSSSNSTEQLYDEQNDQRAESQEADDEKSDVSSIPEKESVQKPGSKAVERESPKPETPPADDQTSLQQKSDKPTKKTEDDEPSVQIVPVAAVPSTAFKTGRGKSALSKQRSDEGHTEPVHRSSKKSSSRKSSDKTCKGHSDTLTDKAKQTQQVPVEAPPTAAEQREGEEEEESTSVRPQTLPVVNVEVSEETIPTLDSGSVETDGVQHKLGVVKTAQQIIPTSPHELAASLLSNNSAIKRRSRQHSDKGQSADEGNDEGDYEDDESEEGSDGDTHPTSSSPVMYQPPPKHPRMDNSPHKSQGPSFHHHGPPPPQMSHRRMMIKPPSTLSLDAEPFYPTKAKSQQGHPRMMDAQKYHHEYHHSGSASTPHVVAPPGFSPEDAAYMQHGPYMEKHYKHDYPSPGIGPRPRPRPPPPQPPQVHHGHGKPSPPSPNFSGTVGDGQHFPFVEHPGVDSQEHMPGFHTPTHPDMQAFDGADEVSYPPMAGRRFPDQRRDLPIGGGGGFDAPHAPKPSGRHVTPTGPGPYPEQYVAMLHQQQRQQHMPAPYRVSRGERPPSGFTVTGQRSLWENPNAYRLQPLPGGEDPALLRHQEYLRQRSILLKLYQQEQAALELAVAREQAKRSVETLSSLNQPYRSRSSMMASKVDLPSPSVAENLWEGGGGASSLHDPVGPSQGFDDPGLNESILRQRQMQHYLSSQPPARSRTYSNESDIGGEFVSNPVQVPSSIGHPGLNRAPGPGSSEGRGQSQRSSLDHTTSSGWPSRSVSEVSC